MHRTAGFTSNTVPWEILRAAGYDSRLMEDDAGPTPYADRFMEEVFDRRFRVIFDRLCSGAWNHLNVVVIPRTSEQEHKLYLYLREAARLHASDHVPRVYLYNLLHTRSPESYTYGLDRTREMVRDFDAAEIRLGEAIIESNRARAAVREILQLRRECRLEGSVAMNLIRGFYAEDRHQFAENVRMQLPALRCAPAVSRPRILIKGAPLKSDVLHRLVEHHGGYVAGEDDWRGSRAAGERDIPLEGDPVVAIFEKYYYDAVSPRIYPAEAAETWFQRQIEDREADGVLFYLPHEDDVEGWRYPRHLHFLRTRGVPSLLIRDIGLLEPNAESAAQLATFIEGLVRR